jgi:hypothetical protein
MVAMLKNKLFLLSLLLSASLACSTVQKDWTIMVYIAADNDLKSFAAQNIKQMMEIGSSDFLNLIVELHIRLANGQKVTRRYYIDKGKVYHVNANDPDSQQMDSGDPETLVNFVQWATENYPSKFTALIPWNHGTGALDPLTGRIINSTKLFTFNPTTNKFDLDRTISFLDFMNLHNQINRGVCWDYSTGNYISNQKLEVALKKIQQMCLNGQKLDLLCFDACLMSAVEVAALAQDTVRYMVSSQEVVLGTGLNYYTSLYPFLTGTIDPKNLAQNIVKEYGKSYNPITNDYTMAAMDLSQISVLEDNINTVANLLVECLKKQKGQAVYNAIKASRDKRVCTHFDVPSYLDIHHLFKNLQANLSYFSLTNPADETQLKAQLSQVLEDSCNTIKQVVFANVCGKNLRFAQGISIYFPDNFIDSSYMQTRFATTNQWVTFLKKYLN